jgi:ATP-binding cassette subfamily B (MDR/TAP) protein 1
LDVLALYPDTVEMDSLTPKPNKVQLLFSLAKWKSSAGYLRLLFQTGPSPLDITLTIVGTTFAIAAGLPFPLLGIVLGDLVDSINSNSCADTSQSGSELSNAVKTQIIYMIGITIANFICLYIQMVCWSLVGERLVRRLREQYFSSLLKQELNFFDTLTTGEVSTRLSEDLEAIQTGTSEKVGIFITSISYFVAAYVVAFIKAPRIAGILVSLVPAYLLMGLVGGYFHKKYTAQFSQHVERGTAIASDCLKNFNIVVAFGASERVEKIFASHLRNGLPDGHKKSFVSAMQFGTMYFIGFAANALAYWQGSREIAKAVRNGNGGTSVGSVYTVIFLLVDGKSTTLSLWFILTSGSLLHYQHSGSILDDIWCSCEFWREALPHDRPCITH